MRFKTPFLSAAVALTAVGGAHAANLLTNDGFETGDFTGWSVSNTGTTFTCSDPASYCIGGSPSNIEGAQSGNDYAINGTAGEIGTLSQTFSDTAGRVYDVSGWVGSDGGPCPEGVSCIGGGEGSSFTLAVGGVTFGSGDDPLAAQPWTYYHGQFTGTGSDTLTISSQNNYNYNYFDTFSVTLASVPEPAAWALMLVGFAGLGAAVRVQRRALSSEA